MLLVAPGVGFAATSVLDSNSSYFFAATSYNTVGLESVYFNLVDDADAAPPTLTIATLPDGIPYNALVPINVSTPDTIAISNVQFLVNDVPVAQTATSPYAFSWDTSALAPGAYNISVKAFDAAGNQEVSDELAVTINPVCTLSYAAGANGTISGTTPQTFNPGGSGTPVTAVASPGYHFVSWSDGVTTAARTDANVTSNLSVTASFAINSYTLAYSAGANGTIGGTTPQTVNPGGSGTPVTALASPGYHFVSWSGGVTTAARTDANVTSNISVTATFALNQYTITFAAGSYGRLSGTTKQTVGYGGSTTSVTAVPNTGRHFVNWTGTNGFITTTANPIIVKNVNASQKITAHFR